MREERERGRAQFRFTWSICLPTHSILYIVYILAPVPRRRRTITRTCQTNGSFVFVSVERTRHSTLFYFTHFYPPPPPQSRPIGFTLLLSFLFFFFFTLSSSSPRHNAACHSFAANPCVFRCTRRLTITPLLFSYTHNSAHILNGQCVCICIYNTAVLLTIIYYTFCSQQEFLSIIFIFFFFCNFFVFNYHVNSLLLRGQQCL